MYRIISFSLVLLASAANAAQLDLVLAIDTTGSMSGLIDRAKAELWGVVEQIPDQKIERIRIGLVAFRDRGDAYVTQVVDLDADIDASYQRLIEFEAGGGGDTPEAVNQALHDAVHQIRWQTGPDVHRVIILAGDAPPHMDYPDDALWPETLRQAVVKGISVHAIQCGSRADTRQVWRAIAGAGGGTYAALSSSPEHAAGSPWDAQLAELHRALASTRVPYGDEGARRHLREAAERLEGASTSAAAARVSYLARRGRVATSSQGDLISSLAEGTVGWDGIDDEQLPGDLQTMDPEQRRTFLEDQLDRRRGLLSEVAYYAVRRDAFLADASQPAGAFQRQVVEALGFHD